MSITVTSTTETPEQIATAIAAAKGTEPVKSESEKSDEKTAESDPAENAKDEGDEDVESKEGDDDEGTEDEDKPKKQNGVKKRIDKLLKREKAAVDEAAYWKRKALEGEKSPEPKSQSNEVKPDVSSKPRSENFDTPEEYYEALADWKYDQRKKADEQAASEAKVKTELQTRAESFKESVQSFKENNPDFDEAILSVDDIEMSVAVQELLLKAKNGPELMYQLAKNPEEYERICSLSPLEAAEAFGEFKAGLAKAESKPIKEAKTTSATPPIKPVSGGKGVFVKSIHDPNITFAEYEKIRREEMRKKA